MPKFREVDRSHKIQLYAQKNSAHCTIIKMPLATFHTERPELPKENPMVFRVLEVAIYWHKTTFNFLEAQLSTKLGGFT